MIENKTVSIHGIRCHLNKQKPNVVWMSTFGDNPCPTKYYFIFIFVEMYIPVTWLNCGHAIAV